MYGIVFGSRSRAPTSLWQYFSWLLVAWLLLSSRLAVSEVADLTSYWPLDEGSGSVALDVSNNGNDFTLQGSPRWVEGELGGALSFDGEDDYGEISDESLSGALPASGSQPAESFTLAAWVNFDSLARRQPILSKMGRSAPGVERGFLFGTGEGAAFQKKLYFEVFANDSRKTVVSSDVELQTGVWQHVAATYEFTEDGSSKIRLYLDGEEVGRTDNAVGPVQANGQPLDVGRYFFFRWYQRYFDGQMDALTVFATALSA